MHKHLMLRGQIFDPPTNTEEVVEWIKSLVSFLDMKILQGPFSSYVNQIGNRGLTAVAMIETSHIAFHIWDETTPSLIQFDIYTCGDLNVQNTLDFISQYFKFDRYEYLVYDRENGFELI